MTPFPAAISWSAATDRGARPINEDVFLLATFDGEGVRFLGKTGESAEMGCDYLFAVSDGMGGTAAGEFASRIVCDALAELLPRQWQRERAPDATLVLPTIVAEIHRRISALSSVYTECANMGATLTMVWASHGQATFCHVGDSRLYQSRAGGGLVQVTTDDTYVGWMRQQGMIAERDARNHPRRHVLNRSLGSRAPVFEPAMGQIAWGNGDRLLLCTDGVSDALWDAEIGELLVDPLTDASRMVTACRQRSDGDNATAIILGSPM
jgi:PPM family protein phosphatase